MDTQKNNQESIDLSKMLNNPEKEPKEEKVSEQEFAPEPVFSPKTSKMVKWLIKYSGGLIKSEKIANCILLIFAVIIFAVSLFLFYSQLVPKKVDQSSSEFIDPIQQDGEPIMPY